MNSHLKGLRPSNTNEGTPHTLKLHTTLFAPERGRFLNGRGHPLLVVGVEQQDVAFHRGGATKKYRLDQDT